MKLPMPTPNEIYTFAERAEEAMRNTTSRSCHKLIVENAIRQALQLVIDRMDIQLAPVQLDLGKS